MTRKVVSLLACSLLVNLGAARAHFIWIAAQPAPGDNGALQCCVYFGESPEPGEPHLIGKIAQTKAWVRNSNGEATELKLARSADEKAPALVAPCAKQPAASFEAACDYGVYERGPGVLLQYYAKHLAGDWAKHAARLARAERLALDIVPAVADGQLAVQVLYKGNPAAESEVIIVDPSGEELELKSDAQGRASIPAKGGRYAIRANRIEPDRSGHRDGKQYSQTWHYCTLTLDVASSSPAASAELPAPEALERARAARAIWEEFPGFTADLAVVGPSGEATAKVTISGDGDIALEMPASALTEWVEQQLETLVQHRMPAGEVSEGDVRYADAPGHPLGRKIGLADGDSDSVYRIKDDVITEVNRNAGKLRFTISMLEIARNAENKYLPRSFTMNFFDSQSGELKISLGYFNDWQRVGSFDLPRTILENSAKSGGTTTRQIVFRNCRLLDPKATVKTGHAQSGTRAK